MGFIISVPESIPQKQMNGMIIYFHPTVFDRHQVPTYQGPSYQIISSFYVSQGFIVVSIDYLGEGEHLTNPHPYVLFPEINVRSAMLALNKVSSYLRDNYWPNKKIPLFSAGYSEGGAYSIWFSKCMTQSNACPDVFYDQKLSSYYSFEGSSGLEGAYDLAGVVLPFLTKEINKDNGNEYQIKTLALTNIAKPGLTVLTLSSFLPYYGLGELQVYLNQSFFDMKCELGLANACKIKGNQYNLSSAIDVVDAGSTVIFSAIGSSALGKSLNGHHYTKTDLGNNNSILALVQETLVNRS